jgi:hypothetical protein
MMPPRIPMAEGWQEWSTCESSREASHFTRVSLRYVCVGYNLLYYPENQREIDPG